METPKAPSVETGGREQKQPRHQAKHPVPSKTLAVRWGNLSHSPTRHGGVTLALPAPRGVSGTAAGPAAGRLGSLRPRQGAGSRQRGRATCAPPPRGCLQRAAGTRRHKALLGNPPGAGQRPPAARGTGAAPGGLHEAPGPGAAPRSPTCRGGRPSWWCGCRGRCSTPSRRSPAPPPSPRAAAAPSAASSPARAAPPHARSAAGAPLLPLPAVRGGAERSGAAAGPAAQGGAAGARTPAPRQGRAGARRGGGGGRPARPLAPPLPAPPRRRAEGGRSAPCRRGSAGGGRGGRPRSPRAVRGGVGVGSARREGVRGAAGAAGSRPFLAPSRNLAVATRSHGQRGRPFFEGWRRLGSC